MKKLILTLALFTIQIVLLAQAPKLAVISFDANDQALRTAELTELLRIEISKHNKYEMIDRYEIAESLTEADISSSTCFSKSCLSKAGETLDVDWVVSGSADKLGDALFIRLRMVNLKTKTIEKEVVREFLNIPEKINTMISICVNQLLGLENDQVIINSLSNRESYESAINNPYFQTLNLSGPRMGYTFFTGDAVATLRKSKNEGGYDAFPAFFQMGYQFEKQYLNEGKWQALFEFIPLVSGLDQGYFIPSMTIMNGIRSNKNGLEFAIGPSVNFSSETKKYLAADGTWTRPEDVENIDNLPLEYKADSRGNLRMKTYVVIAAGYSLKSGKLNIPINVFVVPSKDDVRYGFSFGFNARK
jgi:TolB-like protein